jgi:hypothetical protein
MEPFIESGMTFGPYADTHCFRVETSATFKAIGDGVHIAEFLLIRVKPTSPPSVWVAEAKSSSPRPETELDFNKFIGEIRDKLTNALSLCIAAMLNRHPNTAAEVPDGFRHLDLATAGFRLVLIINGHPKAWLPPLQDAMRRALLATAKTWALGPNAVVVINHEEAKHSGLISAP